MKKTPGEPHGIFIRGLVVLFSLIEQKEKNI